MIHSRYLAAVALMMSIIFHSNLNYTPWADLLWSFTQYLEASAILSQFGLFYSKGCDIDTHTSQFVVTQSVSRVIALIFWLGTYKELNELDPLKGSSWLP